MDIFEDYFKFPMKIPEDYFSETNTTFKITFKDDIITYINDFGISFFELQKANILHKNVKDFIPNFHILKNLKTPDHSVYFFKMEFKAPISTPHRLIRRHLCIIKITISKDINLSLNFPFLPIADNPIEINKAFKNILKYTDSISHAIYGPIVMIRAQLHSLYLKKAISDEDYKGLEMACQHAYRQSFIFLNAFHDIQYFDIIKSDTKNKLPNKAM